MTRTTNIVILTGAGISAESGIATFRAADGLWEGHRVEEVATPEGFARNPALVHAFYDARRARLDEVATNPAHEALARLDAEWPGELLIITQNVDDLHERAGAERVLHMHGELLKGWCLACDERFPWSGAMSLPAPAFAGEVAAQRTEGFSTVMRRTPPSPLRDATSPRNRGEESVNMCPRCKTPGQVRPDIVWFGEMPYQMDRIDAALRGCDLFVSIGTSGAVYPAAGFVQTANYCGARTIEINLEPSLGSVMFDEVRIGRAGVEVPKWVGEVLEDGPDI